MRKHNPIGDKMVSIKYALGENYRQIKLKDNESLTEGKAHSEETLGELMDEIGVDENADYGMFCIHLEEAGLMAIRPIAHIELEERIESGLPIPNLLEEW